MNEQRTGLACGFAAYGMWGLFPLFWPLLEPASAFEIVAHRMVWSVLFVALILLVLRRWAWVGELIRKPRRLGMLALAAAVVSVNWCLYIWGVNSGHIVETALGYFINPLVTIALGVLVLHERLRPAQWAAVAIGAAAVVVLSIGYGRLPWIALGLAFSFGAYALIKKKVGMGGLESLAAETAVMFLPALGFLLILGERGESTFAGHGLRHSALLIACGLATALPLVCFGAAATRLPLSTIGLMQYLAPTFQFLIGLFYFHESMPAERWAGFLLVWTALVLLTWDALRTARRTRLAERGAPAAAGPAATAVPGAAVQPGAPATADGAAGH